jgi:hypothetical protein
MLMAENPENPVPLPAAKFCNRKGGGKPNPIYGEGALGNTFTGRMYYQGDDRESLVRTAQEMLTGLGYSVGPKGADGIFGNETEKGVKEFQKEHKDWDDNPLVVDGLIGPETSDALNREMVGLWYDAYQTPVELTKESALLTVTAEALKKAQPYTIEDEPGGRVVIVTPIPRQVEFIQCETWDGWKASGARYVILTANGETKGLEGEDASAYVTDGEGKIRPEHIPSEEFTLFVFPPERVDVQADRTKFTYTYERSGTKIEPAEEDKDHKVRLDFFGDGIKIENSDKRPPRTTVVANLGLLVLTPALGAPGLIGEDGLTVLALLPSSIAAKWKSGTSAERSILKELFLSSLRLQPWSPGSDGWRKESLRPGGTLKRFDGIKEDTTGVVEESKLLGRVSSRVREAYTPWHLDTLFRITFEVSAGDASGISVVNLQGEDTALHLILSDREFHRGMIAADKKYHDEVYTFPKGPDRFLEVLPKKMRPAWDRTAGHETLKKEPVRLLHPAFFSDKSRLNIVHITDVHIATRWDFFEKVLKEKAADARFNNYNTRFSEMIERINGGSEADIIVITGDLVDYNRGHDGSEKNSFKENYLFNQNWILFYQKLLEDYKKPVFTVLGNHEYLPNPYPTIIEVDARAIDIQILPFPILWPLELLIYIAGLCGMMKVNERQGFGSDMNLTRDQVNLLCPEGSDERKQISITLQKEAQPLKKAREEMNEDKIRDFLVAKVNDELVRNTGIWFTCGEAVTWYHLVINPLKDYAVAHGEMSLLFLDWNETCVTGSLLILPRPTNCPSTEQIQLLDRWIAETPGAKMRVLCSHAPVMHATPAVGDRWLVEGLIKDEHDRILNRKDDHEYTDPIKQALPPEKALMSVLEDPDRIFPERKMMYGIMADGQRKNLLARLLKKGNYPIQLILSGHTHTNRIFQVDQETNPPCVRLKRSTDTFPVGPGKPPVFAVTISGGALGWVDEVGEWMEPRPPGYRIVRVQDAITFEEKNHADPPLEIPQLVRDQYNTELDWYGAQLKPADILMRGRAPGEDIRPQHDFDPNSALIGELGGAMTIEDIQDHGDVLQPLMEIKKTVVVKKVPNGKSLTVENNDGTLVVVDHMGSLLVNDNDDIISVDRNAPGGVVTINQNDDDISIRKNEGNIVVRNERAAVSLEQTDRPEVTVLENRGTLRITGNTGGTFARSIVYTERNYGTISIDGNDDQVTVRLNEGTVTIGHNDDEVFIGENRQKGVITVFGNHDKVDIARNSGTIHLTREIDDTYIHNNQDGIINIGGGANGTLYVPPAGSPLRGTINGVSTEVKIKDID